MTVEDTDMATMAELLRRHEAETGESSREDDRGSSAAHPPSLLEREDRHTRPLLNAASSGFRAPTSEDAIVLTRARTAGGKGPIHPEQGAERLSLQARIARDFRESSFVKKASALLLVGTILVSLGRIVAQEHSQHASANTPAIVPQKSTPAATPVIEVDEERLDARTESVHEVVDPGRPTPIAENDSVLEERSAPATAVALDADTPPIEPGIPASERIGELTVERRAVDAVLAGDRKKALELYRRLSSHRPDSEVFRQAVVFLSREQER